MTSRPPIPAPARSALAALSAGALAGLWVGLSVSHIGASPGTLLCVSIGLLVGIFLAGMIPWSAPAGGRGAILLLLPAPGVVLLDPGLMIAGSLGLTAHTSAVLAGALVVGMSLPWLAIIARLTQGSRLLLLAALPGLGAALLPPLAGALLVAALVGAAWGGAKLPKVSPRRDGLAAVPGVALAGVAASVGLVSLRGMLDPTPLSALVLLLGAGAAFAISRRVAPPPGPIGLLLGAGALLLLWAGWGAGWVAAVSLTEQAMASEQGRVLLAVPFLLIGLLSGGAAGAAWGRSPAPLALLGLALGLSTALLGLPPQAPPVIIGVVGLLVVFWSARMATRAAGLAVGAAGILVFLSDRGPTASLASEGLYSRLRTSEARAEDAEIRAGMRAAISGWGPRGIVSVRAPESAWGELSAPRAPRLHIELDGLVAETPSRAAAADSLAGHLAALLPTRPESIAVLGDDLGEAAQALLAHRPGRVRIAAPLPHAIRAIASLDASRQRAWLSPSVRLVPAHPELVLRTSSDLDAIVEIVRAPWADAARSLPRADRAAARLTDGGVYIGVLHLSWWDEGTPQAVVAEFADRFSHLQLWLPPAGADALLLIASDTPLPLARLVDRASPAVLSDLEMSVPLDLASLAIADRDAAAAWAQEPAPLRPLSLPAAIFSLPHLHIGALAEASAEPAAIWSMAERPEDVAPLTERMTTRRTLLGLLSEAAAGNMAGVFEKAGEIKGTTLSVETLDPLIDPHLESARSAIAAATAEGPDSARWDAAARYATTARMLSPDSPRPLIAMGQIAAGQNNFVAAEEHFTAALQRSPGELGALTALARIAHRRGDLPEAERLMREAIVANPQSWPAHLNLGTLLLSQGRSEGAEAMLRRAASLSGGEEPAPHTGLAQVYLNTDQPVRALGEAELACQLDGGGFAWFLRGRAHFELEQYDQAEKDYQRAVLLDPDLVIAHGAFAHVRALRGDLQTARDSYRLVLLKDPDNAAARENLRRIEQELAAGSGAVP